MKIPIRRSGVSAERRKPLRIEERGFLPKAATLLCVAAHSKFSTHLFLDKLF
jgi:hypothetical protein